MPLCADQAVIDQGGQAVRIGHLGAGQRKAWEEQPRLGQLKADRPV